MKYIDVDEILKQVDIVDVISKYIDLEHKGKNFFGVCPFHDDTSPSLSVSPEKQIYKCFSCGASGNALTFIKDFENIDFKHSLKKLADFAGIDVEIDTTTKTKDPYYEIYERTSQMFSYALLHVKENLKYLNYLYERKFSLEVIKYFGIGVSDKRVELFLKDKFDNKDLVNSGLITSSGRIMFHSRIMFPICNDLGEVVACSGRVIDNSTPKYINSPETNYFIKGKVLYNFDKAASEIKKTGEVFITEGFFDAMRLHDNGFPNVVALMGTAFTKEHLNLLSNLAKKVYLCLDGDNAGKKTSHAIYLMCESNGLDTKMINLDDCDPDEFILTNGADAFKDFVSKAKTYEEYFIDLLSYNFDVKQISEKQEIIEKIANFVDRISNDYKKKLVADYANEKTGANINFKIESRIPKQNYQSRQQIRKSQGGKDKSAAHVFYIENVKKHNAINKFELMFLKLMQKETKYVEKYTNEIKELNIFENNIVAMLIKECYLNPDKDIKTIFEEQKDDYNEQESNKIFHVIEILERTKVDDSEELIDDLYYRIIYYKYDSQIDRLLSMLQEPLSKEQKSKIIDNINVLKRRKVNIMESRGVYSERD